MKKPFVLLVAACLLISTSALQATLGILKIHMFSANDGRGDCHIVELPDNSRMVIDIPSGWSSALRTKLSSLGISNVKYLVGTHEHVDHIGGLNDFLNSGFTINNTQVYYPKGSVNANSGYYNDLVTACNSRGLALTKLVAGDYIVNTNYNGKPLIVRLLSPENSKVNGGTDDWGSENEASIVLKITYGTKSILMQADAYGSVELSILAGPFSGEINNCQVLKAGHHGLSANGAISCRESYLDAAGVKKALITNGDRAMDATIKSRLQARNIHYWSTGSGDGYSWLSTDGAADWVEGEPPLWPPAVAPSITTQPSSLTVTPGATATFSVTASGTDPLSYQWRFKGTNLSGATTSTYTRTNVQSIHAGNYSVVVSNTVGSVTSANAVLFVSQPPALTTQLVLNDTFNGTSTTNGFDLGNGINWGINPPTTRLIGIASTNLRYLQTAATKPASVYGITNNTLRIQTNSNIGRFTLSADGVTPFDFSNALGSTNASPTQPIVYEVRISMRNDSTSAARFSFGISTTEGDINAMDCAVQVYRNASGDGFYTVAERVDTGSSGVADFGLTTLTATAPTNAVTTFLPILIRITDAGAESGTNYNSRAQISINNGSSWIFDTDSDTALTNGWRFDGPARLFLFDIAGNTSGDVYYDEFSVKLLPTWNGGGDDNNWSTGANWNGGTPQIGDTLYFAGTNRLAPFMETDYAVGPVTVLPGAGSFNIGATVDNVLLLGGDILQSSANAQTISAPISIEATRTITTPSGALTLSGDISGSGGITKAQTGSLTLSGMNSYSGKTTISRGTVFFNSIANVGNGPSALGVPTTVTNGTINLGSGTTASSLRYTGSGHTTDRVINLSSTTGGPSIYASGSGPLVFTSDFTATGANSKTLTLRGTSTDDNTIGGAIVNNATTNITSVTKNDAGKWILDGANTYTGPTTITAGKLEVNGSTSASSAVSVAAAGTLSGIGIVGGSVTVTGTISGGTDVGKLTTGALTLNSSGTDLFEILTGTGTPGVNWDFVDAGVNNINVQATSASPFKFKLKALPRDAFETDGEDFDNNLSYSWPAMAGSVQNFAADKFTIDNTAFTNDIAGGTFSVESTGNSLNVRFDNNHSPLATSTNVTFAAGTPFTLPIADLLANLTSDADGDARVLVTLVSTNAAVTTNPTNITIFSANASTESIAYIVRDARVYRPGDTVRTATNFINAVITSAPNGGTLTISKSGGNANLSFQGNAGQNYVIERSQDLIGWTGVYTNTANGSGVIQFSEVPPVTPAFYRARPE